MSVDLDAYLDAKECGLLDSLDSPAKIQAFLDQTPYSTEDANRCPVRVLRERVAHCLDGALFAAAVLRRSGHPPLLVDLLPEPGSDDDHVLAIYRVDRHYGAVAKSNFSGLRFREPVYRSVRELVMSYFEFFFNVNGEKTLRSYTPMLDLSKLDHFHWMVSDTGADVVEQRLIKLRRFPLFSPAMAARLSPVDTLTYQAGTLGTNPDGMYKPGEADRKTKAARTLWVTQKDLNTKDTTWASPPKIITKEHKENK